MMVPLGKRPANLPVHISPVKLAMKILSGRDDELFARPQRRAGGVDVTAHVLAVDDDRAASRARLRRPRGGRIPEGIEMAWDNGELVWSEAGPTGARPGHVVRRVES